MNEPTEPVKARVKYSSAKALFVELRNGRHLWLPKSLIHSEYQESDTEMEQVFEVSEWFVRKEGLVFDGWC